eukprot:5074319-Pyramimonas_sp.AAC.2
MASGSTSSRASRWSSAACASILMPFSLGEPSLSPYPRYDRMNTFTSSRAISCITFCEKSDEPRRVRHAGGTAGRTRSRSRAAARSAASSSAS